jgi:hypothetical protein
MCMNNQHQATQRWPIYLLILSLIVATASGGFVWWVAGVRIDAADSFTQEPAAASWGGAALITFGLSLVGAIVSAIIVARTTPPPTNNDYSPSN